MITLKELSFSYSRKKEVLDRINLEVGSHIYKKMPPMFGKNSDINNFAIFPLKISAASFIPNIPSDEYKFSTAESVAFYLIIFSIYTL